MIRRTDTLRRAATRFTAVAATAATAAATALTMAAPAEAAPSSVTDFGYSGGAFGSKVLVAPAGAASNRTALSNTGCTRRVDQIERRAIAHTEAPHGDNSQVTLGAVHSYSRTFRAPKGFVGQRSMGEIAGARLGEADGPHLVVRGLKAKTWAYANPNNGTMFTKVETSVADIEANTGTALDDLFSGADDGLDDLASAIADNGGDSLDIPGLGRIGIGDTRERKGKRFAQSDAVALKVRLFGPDGVAGGDDDTVIHLGRSRSRIVNEVYSGVFTGIGAGARGELLDGVGRIGPLGFRQLGCAGTNGNVLSNSVADVDLGNAGAIQVSGLRGDSYGVQRRNGAARAFTRGRVANIALGTGEQRVEIEGVRGEVMLRQGSGGRVRTGFGGSTIGSLTIGGEKQEIPDPGQTIEVPGLARIEFLDTRKGNRFASIVAVRITLLDDTAGVSELELGVARTAIKPN